MAEAAPATERADLERTQRDALADVEAARQATEAACTSERQAVAVLVAAQERLADHQRLIDQQNAQILALGRHRDEAVLRGQQADAEVAALHLRVETLQGEAEAARLSSMAHLQAVEDRAHSEVDRARQELVQFRQHTQAADKSKLARVRQLETELAEARSDTAQLQRTLACEQGRRDALEQQASALHARLEQTLANEVNKANKPRTTRVRTRRKPL